MATEISIDKERERYLRYLSPEKRQIALLNPEEKMNLMKEWIAEGKIKEPFGYYEYFRVLWNLEDYV